MNYRHIYHAGNFADVIKHLTIKAVLEKLLENTQKISVLDAFAGIGSYNLNSLEALKTKEADFGIKKLFQHNRDAPSLIKGFIKLVEDINCNNELNLYPGSPLIISKLLRIEDEMIASELHPLDFKVLESLFINDERVKVKNIDAYKAIKLLLPFNNSQELILLDPAFEDTKEFIYLEEAVKLIYRNSSNAVTVIWYPIKNQSTIENLFTNIKSIIKHKTLKIEFCLNDPIYLSLKGTGLTKTGLIIINPPNIEEVLKENMKFLVKVVYSNKADYEIAR